MKKIKKAKELVCGVAILACIFSVSQVYAGHKNDADKDGTQVKNSRQVKNNVYVSKSAKKGRKITTNKKNIEVSYEETQVVDKNLITNEDNKQYGEYDIYHDTDNNEYIYLSGTDEYCGFRKSNIGSSELKIKINESKAKDIAKKYLSTIVTNDKGYQLSQVVYQEWGYYYDITFNLYTNGIKTDEEIHIWVNTEGDVISYSNLMNGCYTDVSVDRSKVTKMVNDTENKIKKELVGNEYSIDNQCLTYTEDGTLALETTYSYFITDGVNKMSYEDAIVTPVEE
ncbi:MAG: hypothetical protein Q4F05_05720 [bacterium]|nr:hypothetical protein [bacterium]